MADGYQLKCHRDMDGSKSHVLHASDGRAYESVSTSDVQRLVDQGLIVSNMKFPADAYLLTDVAEAQAQETQSKSGFPLRVRMPGM